VVERAGGQVHLVGQLQAQRGHQVGGHLRVDLAAQRTLGLAGGAGGVDHRAAGVRGRSRRLVRTAGQHVVPAQRAVEGLAAEHHDVLDAGQVGPDRGDVVGLLDVDEHRDRAAVGDHEAHLVGGEPVGQRHRDQPDLAGRVEHDQHLDAVGTAPDHPVTGPQAQLAQAVGQPVGPGLQLGVGEGDRLVGVDHRGFVGRRGRPGGEDVGLGGRHVSGHVSGHGPTFPPHPS
jgi:hypothetical protein